MRHGCCPVTTLGVREIRIVQKTHRALIQQEFGKGQGRAERESGSCVDPGRRRSHAKRTDAFLSSGRIFSSSGL